MNLSEITLLKRQLGATETPWFSAFACIKSLMVSSAADLDLQIKQAFEVIFVSILEIY